MIIAKEKNHENLSGRPISISKNFNDGVVVFLQGIII
jgi:hypothetical protein